MWRGMIIPNWYLHILFHDLFIYQQNRNGKVFLKETIIKMIMVELICAVELGDDDNTRGENNTQRKNNDVSGASI